MTKTFGRIFRLQVSLILISNLLFVILFISFAFGLYRQAIADSTDKVADNLIYIMNNREEVEDFISGGDKPGFELKRFFPLVQTIRAYDKQGNLLHSFGDKDLDETKFPRRLFATSIRSFRHSDEDELLILKIFPDIRPGGGAHEPSYWIWNNVKKTGLILLVEMVVALAIAFFHSRYISRDSRRLSASLLRLSDGHWEEEIPDGIIEENRHISEAARILQYKIIRQRKMILRRLQELTHDLKSPISGVYTQIEAIELGSLPLTEERFSRIYGELKYLNGLVDDMAEHYRLEDDALPISIKAITSRDFLDTLQLRFEPLAHKGKKQLVCRSEIENFNGDSNLLFRGVGNLLSNAIIHGTGSSISLNIRSFEDRVLIEVENEGQIPEKDHSRIMSRYWSRGKKGSGLGLSIADLIAQKHQGTLSFRNTDRDSVTFTITLPMS